jgi:5'(3')-deoxyribonucleotidase
MDGVLADFELEMAHRWHIYWPDDDIDQYKQRPKFKYSSMKEPIDNINEKFEKIWSEPGFFESLPEIEGGIEAVTSLLDMGYDVRVVTSAGNKRQAFTEKANWIYKRLGDNWVRRLVVTNEKHFIDGAVLIDDRPEIARGHNTTWQQIIYDQSYNQYVNDRPRLSWSDEDWLDTIESTVAQVQAER